MIAKVAFTLKTPLFDGVKESKLYFLIFFVWIIHESCLVNAFLKLEQLNFLN